MRADARENYGRILEVAQEVVSEQGIDASLRDIARKAGVGLGTLYRHFPTRASLLEALLHASLDALALRAAELEEMRTADEALLSWLREGVHFVQRYNGVVNLMAAALADETSALHAACETVRAAGARLLRNAQSVGIARDDIDGVDLFALIGALGWLGEQPSFAPRAERLIELVAGAIFIGSAVQSGDTLDR